MQKSGKNRTNLKIKEISGQYFTAEDQILFDKILAQTKSGDLSSIDSNIFLKVDANLLLFYLRRKLSDRKYVQLLYEVGSYFALHGDSDFAADLFNNIISINAGNWSKKYKAKSYFALAEINARQGYWLESRKYLNKAKTLYSELKDRNGLADSENFLGTIFAEKGEIKKARLQFIKALEIIKSSKENLIKCKILNNLGILNTITHNYSKARENYEDALKTFNELSDTEKVAKTHFNIGMLYVKENKYDKALGQFRISNKIASKNEIYPISGISYLGMAQAFLSMDKLEFAEKNVLLCIEYSNKVNDRLTVADAYKTLGIIKKQSGNPESAEALLHVSLRLNNEFGNDLNYAETCYQLGLFYNENNKSDESRKYLQIALQYYKGINSVKESTAIESLL